MNFIMLPFLLIWILQFRFFFLNQSVLFCVNVLQNLQSLVVIFERFNVLGELAMYI